VFRIKQTNSPSTISHLNRIWKIATFQDLIKGEWEGRLGPQGSDAVARIRDEVGRVVDGTVGFRGCWEEVRIECPRYWKEWDEMYDEKRYKDVEGTGWGECACV
jgi:hypothetical protein